MLTSWLTFTAFLAASANPERAALTVAPTCRVKGHPEAELTLNCGDGKIAGVAQYWHTPFGDLQPPASHSELDPVFIHSDGSLVVPNTSILHSGLYYCLMQHAQGTTLWPYKLHVGHSNQKNQEDSEYEQHHSSCGAFRFRRDVGSEAESQDSISDELFASVVAASVLLTFVVGFSAGALSRTWVLRCLRAVTTRLPSLRKQRCQTATCDSELNMTDLPPVCDNKDFEADTSAHSTTSSPPAKPQRSFRHKPQREEERQETTAYLEGCDHIKEERRREEVEEVAGGSLEEQNKVCDGVTEEEEVEEEERVFYLSEDGGSQTETDEGECSEEREEKDGRESEEEEKEVEEERNKEGGDRRGSMEELGGNKEQGSDEKEGWKEEKEVEEKSEQGEDRRESVEAGGNKEEERDEEKEEEEGGDGETDSCSEDDEIGSQEQEDTIKSGTTEEEEPASSAPRPARRIIRLYQYDDDGQRYAHLPEPAPIEPCPAPRLRQRSISLTRLSAIMAAASAGPLDERAEEKEERTHFHMEI